MTTTDTDALKERIARILNAEGWTFEGVHEPGDYDGCEDCRRVVDPIAARIAEEITTEVRAAKAEAWDEGALKAWSVSTIEVNGQRYHWRKSGEPKNPYTTETGDQA